MHSLSTAVVCVIDLLNLLKLNKTSKRKGQFKNFIKVKTYNLYFYIYYNFGHFLEWISRNCFKNNECISVRHKLDYRLATLWGPTLLDLKCFLYRTLYKTYYIQFTSNYVQLSIPVMACLVVFKEEGRVEKPHSHVSRFNRLWHYFE